MPKLGPMLCVLVVDSSRSMVGERARRARALAGELLASMDPRDRVRVLACDETCRPLSTEAEGVGGDLRARVDSFLSSRQPDGGSDLAAAVRTHRVVVARTRAGHGQVPARHFPDVLAE